MAVAAESLLPEPGRHPWLESLIRPNLRPYAERAPQALPSMRRLLDRFGNPHRGLRCVHLAGSKGKGATALMIEALLEAGGVSTGTYTSPHLERWTERFRLGGREISADTLNEALDALRPHVDALCQMYPDNPPSFFDVATAAALWLFDRGGVEVGIIETGIGGRFDATNVIDSAVACITNVELEHADKLGNDLASIAAHKAGILKPGSVAVLGAFDRAAAEVIRAQAEANACETLWLGRDFDIRRSADQTGQTIDYRRGDLRLRFSLGHPGRHMADNAALALTCAARIGDLDARRLGQAARALAAVSLPGRTEILRRRPWWVVDAAHTERSIAALAEALDPLPARDRHFVISLSGDKPAALLAPLLETAAAVTATSPEPLRSMPAAKLAAALADLYPGAEIHLESDTARAIGQSISRLGPESLLCVTGSTYVAGTARRLLRARLNAGDAACPTPGERKESVTGDSWRETHNA